MLTLLLTRRKPCFTLQLDKTKAIHLALKDIYHKYFVSECVKDLLSEGPNAEAGLLYVRTAMSPLFACLKICGIAARVVLDQGSTKQHELWLSNLREELEKGCCVRWRLSIDESMPY